MTTAKKARIRTYRQMVRQIDKALGFKLQIETKDPADFRRAIGWAAEALQEWARRWDAAQARREAEETP